MLQSQEIEPDKADSGLHGKSAAVLDLPVPAVQPEAEHTTVSYLEITSPPAHAQPSLTPSPVSRLAGIDVLRGGAMLLGVFIHAAVSYMPSSLIGLRWGITETETSPFIGALFWWLHVIRLPLFFLIAGFFAVSVHDKLGTRGFLAHRLKRLFVPFLAGIVLMLPLGLLYGWTCGVVTYKVTDGMIVNFQMDPQIRHDMLGPMHLWFLEDLLILSVIFVAGQALLRIISTGNRRTRIGEVSRRYSLVCPVALAVPTIALLWLDARPVIDHWNTFTPLWSRLLHYGYFFALGAGFHRYRTVLASLFAWPVVHLTLSLVAGTGLLVLLPRELAGDLIGTGSLAFAACAALLAWFSIFGFMGLTLRYFNGPHPVISYLADSSYWIYLCHLPIVCLLQVGLYETSLPQNLSV